jgi:prepilin signal peptidase PulO-like enzyme (type II secretory pathway)
MNLTKRNWAFAFSLIIFAVAVVVLVQIAGNQISSVRELLHLLAYALVYAIVAGVLGVLVLGGLAERLVLRKFPLVPFVALGAMVAIALGCLLAQALLMGIGLVVPPHF